jgi:hypothetical protein
MRTPHALVLVAALVASAAAPLTLAGIGTPAFASFVMPSSFAAQNNSGEPSIGVDPATNAAFFQADATTAKVTWDATGAATWSDVTALTSVANLDPILFTDRVTHRTYAGGDTVCGGFQFTDDDGATWVPVGNMCALPAYDHPSIASGKWHEPEPLPAQLYPRVTYYCAQNGGDDCSTSYDGGLTWLAPVAVSGDCSSFHGHIKVSELDGTAFVPSSYCGKLIGGFRSTDDGKSWQSYHIPNTRIQSNGGGFDPSVGITPDGTVYEAWADGVSNHPMVARSTTEGATWDRVTDLSATVTPAIRNSTFQDAVVGDDGRVAVAYLGSADANGANPYGGNFAGTWDLYVSYSYDGGLTWSTVKATTDPVQRGCIYDVVNTVSCHRNLLDFMDATMDAQGRVLVAYADGCVSAACTGPSGTSAQSVASVGTIARQMSGQGLLAAFDGQP